MRLHWVKNKILIMLIIMLSIYVASFQFDSLKGVNFNMTMYLGEMWWAIILGFLIGGLIHTFVPSEYITKALAEPSKRSIFNAVGFGFTMSICSHGILALAVQLYKKGASPAAVVAFLLASPWANFTLTLLLISFFGLLKALYIIIAAVIIAIVTGHIFLLLMRFNLIETNPHTIANHKDFSIMKDLKARVKNYDFTASTILKDCQEVWRGGVRLANMVLWWILLGITIASVVGAFIPPFFFHDYMGPNFIGMMVTLIAATVLEVCSEGTAPLAFEIFRQTGYLGNPFVFLMAGVATDYTEIGILWYNIGRKTALWMPIIAVPQIILFGTIANIIF